ncbi:MAG: 2-oxoglutarate dehydrogenase complex dihydrolipoyllysine-residue succinyltransferase [Pseudomonadota bacterium]|nr:2-oxoglutarate dehydrogenase complex dihydrolipoyllysine-residue succinyltransferase [Pseudomonadota bacterium]
MIKIVVPTLGESVTEATVATWFKKPGDPVSEDEMLCELETDKVTVEVPSSADGVLVKIVADEGSVVGLNAVLAEIDDKDVSKIQKTVVNSPTNKVQAEQNAMSNRAKKSNEDVENAPSAKKLMKEANLDPAEIIGSGRDGRIMKEDVLSSLAKQKDAKSIMPSSKKLHQTEDQTSSSEERIKMSRLRQTIAKRLKEAQNTAAMLTTYNEVDMSKVMEIRKKYKEQFELKHNVKLGFMSFFVKACCHALLEVPEVNAEIDELDIVYKKYVNMSVAVGTPTGLVAPVIRNAECMSFAQIEKSLSNLSSKARDGKLSIDEMKDGTFTISNGGVYGSLMSSPILNPPQSGILGMHKIQDRPVVLNGEIVIRPMMYLALSYDHRIVDGKGAVTFLVRVKESLEDPNRLLMDL